MSSITNGNHLNWFDNICAESRSKFFANELESKEPGQLSDDLISKNECYTFIKEKIKRSQIEREDILWKIPIILISLGCFLVILMALSFVGQCLVMRLKNSGTFEKFESDICKVEEEAKVVIPSSAPSASPKGKVSPKSKCCSCLSAK